MPIQPAFQIARLLDQRGEFNLGSPEVSRAHRNWIRAYHPLVAALNWLGYEVTRVYCGSKLNNPSDPSAPYQQVLWETPFPRPDIEALQASPPSFDVPFGGIVAFWVTPRKTFFNGESPYAIPFTPPPSWKNYVYPDYSGFLLPNPSATEKSSNIAGVHLDFTDTAGGWLSLVTHTIQVEADLSQLTNTSQFIPNYDTFAAIYALPCSEVAKSIFYFLADRWNNPDLSQPQGLYEQLNPENWQLPAATDEQAVAVLATPRAVWKGWRGEPAHSSWGVCVKPGWDLPTFLREDPMSSEGAFKKTVLKAFHTEPSLASAVHDQFLEILARRYMARFGSIPQRYDEVIPNVIDGESAPVVDVPWLDAIMHWHDLGIIDLFGDTPDLVAGEWDGPDLTGFYAHTSTRNTLWINSVGRHMVLHCQHRERSSLATGGYSHNFVQYKFYAIANSAAANEYVLSTSTVVGDADIVGTLSWEITQTRVSVSTDLPGFDNLRRYGTEAMLSDRVLDLLNDPLKTYLWIVNRKPIHPNLKDEVAELYQLLKSIANYQYRYDEDDRTYATNANKSAVKLFVKEKEPELETLLKHFGWGEGAPNDPPQWLMLRRFMQNLLSMNRDCCSSGQYQSGGQQCYGGQPVDCATALETVMLEQAADCPVLRAFWGKTLAADEQALTIPGTRTYNYTFSISGGGLGIPVAPTEISPVSPLGVSIAFYDITLRVEFEGDAEHDPWVAEYPGTMMKESVGSSVDTIVVPDWFETMPSEFETNKYWAMEDFVGAFHGYEEGYTISILGFEWVSEQFWQWFLDDENFRWSQTTAGSIEFLGNGAHSPIRADPTGYTDNLGLQISAAASTYQAEVALPGAARPDRDTLLKHYLMQSAGHYALSIQQWFDSDQHGLSEDGKRELRNLVAEELAIMHHAGTHLKLKGYADTTASEAYNLDLSLKRCRTVYQFIRTLSGTKFAVREENVSLQGLGEGPAHTVGNLGEDVDSQEWRRVDISLNNQLVISR